MFYNENIIPQLDVRIWTIGGFIVNHSAVGAHDADWYMTFMIATMLTLELWRPTYDGNIGVWWDLIVRMVIAHSMTVSLFLWFRQYSTQVLHPKSRYCAETKPLPMKFGVRSYGCPAHLQG